MIDYSKFDQKRFLTGKPFPNIVIDDLFDTDFLNDIQNDYPSFDDLSWWKYNNHFEKKLAFNNVRTLSRSIQDFFTIVNSWKFVKNLEVLTKIPDLIADPSLHGGGLHRIEKGGKLDIHADFNYHKVTGWRRRLNMITFLNKEWKESYGGSIEFWNQDMTSCVTKIPPFFNRTVIFTVDDDTWHGHPDPLSCPDSMVRRSLATYYYTLHDDNLDNLDYRSTDYQKRPSDLTSDNIEKMRTKRRLGRLEDLKT